MGSKWTETSLGELLKFSNGKSSPDRSDDHSIRVYGSNGIIGYCEESNAEAETIIIGRVGSYCGSTYLSKDSCWVTDNAIKARSRAGNDPRFLFYLLGTLDLNRRASGSGQPLLNQSILSCIDVIAPPLPEQKRIAHILGSLDDKIELNRKMNETLEAMAQALFKSWFIDFDPVIDNALRAGNRIPEEFEERAARRRALLDQNQPSPPTPLPGGEGSDLVIDNAIRAGNPIPEEFAERTARRQALLDQNQPSPPTPLPGGEGSDSLSDSSFPNKFPPLSLGEGRGEGVPWHLFPSSFRHSEELGWIPEGWEAAKLSDLLEVKYGKDHKKLSEGNIPVYGSGGVMRHADKSLYCGESVLIPRKGTLSNILYLNEEFWTVDTMFYTIPKHEYAPKYAFHHLKGLDFTSMNVGSAVPSMTTKVLNELPMVMPDDISLRRFDEILTSYFDKSNANNKQSQYLTQLRDSLLPKLISGDLCIQDEDKVRS